MFIPDQLTPLDPDTAAQAIATGYKNVTGKKPDKKTLALLIGQAALETANFRSMHNYNFGNVRGEAPDGKYTSFRAGEIDAQGREYFLEAGDPKNKFRAFDDAISGATDYVRMLQSRPNWWEGLHTKTVEGFAQGLSSYPAYFTASPTVYAKVLAERSDKYVALANKYGGIAVASIATAVLAGGFGFWVGKKLRGT